MIAKYVCSNGKEYDLIGATFRVTSGNFHKSTWKAKATQMEKGDKLYGFTKESMAYSLTFTMRGTLDQRKKDLDEIEAAFEYDIANVSPGRFWCGDYYAEGYILETEIEKSGTWNTWTNINATLYCPYPFWVKEQEKSFYPEERNHGEAYEFLEYPYDYLYDYSRQKSGSQNWIIDHFKKSNFKMIIYGPCTDPRITINGHVYQIYDTLESTDYVVIESRDKKITKHLANRTTQNILFKRRKDVSIFEPLPYGNLLVNWNGEFGFDITAYLERSVPEWI